MNDVIPFLALIVTVTMCGLGFMVARAFTLRMKGPAPSQADARLIEEVEDLRERVATLQGQLDEVLERQDFTERVLAQVKERAALGPGPANGGR